MTPIPQQIINYHASTGLKRWWKWLVLTVIISIAVFTAVKRIQKYKKELDDAKEHLLNLTLLAAAKEHSLSKVQDRVQTEALVKSYNEIQHKIDAADRKVAQSTRDLDAEYRRLKAMSSWTDLNEYNQHSRQ